MVSETVVDAAIFKRVQRVITRQLDIPPSLASPNARLREDLGADSLDLVELVMAISREFGDDVLDEDFCQVQTLGEWAAYIDQKCAGMREPVHA